MTTPAAYYELRQAFGESGCAFCRLLSRTADRYIDGVLWEMVNDPEVRHKLTQARGYCREHAWLLARRGASLGAAILLQDVIDTLLDVLEQGRFEAPSSPAFSRVWQPFNATRPVKASTALVDDLSPQIACPACAAVYSAEQHYIEALLTHLSGPESLVSRYRTSGGLCLLHFRRALSRLSDETTFKALVDAQKTVWEHLRADLQEFIRKNNYNVQEDFGPEGDSWLRAIEAIAGARPERGDR